MTEPFVCEMLRENEKNKKLVQKFVIDREKKYSGNPNRIIGLESYLKYCAWEDDENDLVRIYLVKDKNTSDIVAYFGLKAGMIAANMQEAFSVKEQQEIFLEEGVKVFPEILPGIEISHFAVNDAYRKQISKGNVSVKGLGKYIYPEYIYPLIMDVGKKIGVHMVYLYAAGDEKLIHYYKETFGFQEMDESDHYTPLEPEYDGGCKFMYQRFYS